LIDSADSMTLAQRLTTQCRWLPPLFLVGSSLLLTYLPARCGNWIMGGTGLLFLAAIMPAPEHWRHWWRAMSNPEALRAGGHADEREALPMERKRTAA
jgi:hypothetical protein